MLSDIRALDPVPTLATVDAQAYAGIGTLQRARCVLVKSTPAEVLPGLSSALAQRFAAVMPERLHRDLLSPLKKAVGNAHKRGNRRDPEKLITVEIVTTELGAFLEVSDEGPGFDVSETLERFQSGREYFAHHGSGFRRFTKARSVVSFAREGSCFRLRFLIAEASAPRRKQSPEISSGS